jgi:hypothetical protein
MEVLNYVLQDWLDISVGMLFGFGLLELCLGLFELLLFILFGKLELFDGIHFIFLGFLLNDLLLLEV